MKRLAIHNPNPVHIWGPYTGHADDLTDLQEAGCEVAVIWGSLGVLIRNPEFRRNVLARNSAEWQQLELGGYVVFQETGCVYPITASAYARNYSEVRKEVYPS